MARIASVQIAGYYPTPRELLPSCASIFRWRERQKTYRPLSLLDPCAGDGEAIATLRDEWCQISGLGASRLQITGNELEGERARALRDRLGVSDTALEGDAFHLHWGEGSARATLLFLNPPYDADPHERRLEQKFLRRFTGAIHRGEGYLLYLVPAPTLGVSAGFLARNFLDLKVWRFPDPHFEHFRQVLVAGRRSPAPLDQSGIESTLAAWGADPGSLPVLPDLCPDPYEVELREETSYPLYLSHKRIDLRQALERFRPFEGSPTGVDLDADELLGARFQTAVPPKPAHIALALSSGMFNGHRLEPNDPDRDPPILAKGRFERELVEVAERRNKDGDLTGTVEIQQPRLRLTLLRLDTYRYATLEPGVVPTGSDELSEWNAADLIERYDRSLARLLARQFPPLHDPADPAQRLALPRLARRPFNIQSEAVQAMLKLLATGQNPFLVAEVGTGKTTMALFVAAALSPAHREATLCELARLGLRTDALPTVRRTLVLCPPHLLKSWTDEIAAVLPEARVVWLRTLSDLDKDADFYLLSRESAKLGHAYRGLAGRCPRCAAPIETSASKNASGRLRCQARRQRPSNRFAELAEILAGHLAGTFPNHPLVGAKVRSPILRRRLERDPRPLDPRNLRFFHRRVLSELAEALEVGSGDLYELLGAVSTLAHLVDDVYATASKLRDLAAARETPSYAVSCCRDAAERLCETASSSEKPPQERLLQIFERFCAQASWTVEGTCDEPLYEASPRPRRYPLAQRILHRRYRSKFNLLVADEAHEYANSRSAQTHALHRLASLSGVPAILLTGSLMSGYASSLFPSFWLLSPRFREEFERDEKRAFVRRYGYRKFFVSAEEKASKPSRFGAHSDRRIDGRIHDLGEAPGILPTFLMRHLLPTSVLVHKSELDEELPSKDELSVAIGSGDEPRDDELLAEHDRIKRLLLGRISQDRFVAGRSGKLLGALLELPSYLDRASEDQGEFRVAYPENVGGEVLTIAQSFPVDYRTPKERWLIEELRNRLAADEKVLVFLRHTGSAALPRRLLQLLETEVTDRAVWLDAQRVPAKKRHGWIDRHVLEPAVKVLLVNPDAVRTGLNNLVSFTTAIWYEPTYSAFTYRQANGRIHRIGQTRPVTILAPYYPGTAQEVAIDLVARKVTASLQVDGLDLQAALEAAGASESSTASIASAMQLGEAVYRALTRHAA
jgi:hypothetical protein